MPAPYSYALRKKAIEAVKRGERKTEVCRLLKISRNTLDLWIKKEKATETIKQLLKGEEAEN
jgi:transposase